VRYKGVLNNLYLIVFILLNDYPTTSIFKHDLSQVKGFAKYFKQIHTTSSVINKKVFFENLLFSQIIFDFQKSKIEFSAKNYKHRIVGAWQLLNKNSFEFFFCAL